MRIHQCRPLVWSRTLARRAGDIAELDSLLQPGRVSVKGVERDAGEGWGCCRAPS